MMRWLSTLPAIVALIVSRTLGSLRHNWGTGVLSVALAVALWVFVTNEENPDRTERVPGSVPVEVVNVPQGQAVFSLSETGVTVRARASESVHENLTAEDFDATVDLAGVTGTATVRVEVESNESRAEVVDVSPAEITVTLESITTRTVPVSTELVGTPPAGYDIGAITFDPVEVEVTGPQSLVNDTVTSVVAEINLTGVRTNIQQTVLLQPRDEAGGTVSGLNVEPESARVTVAVTQVNLTLPFLVRPVFDGAPAAGYNVASVTVEPAIVLVTGSAEVLGRIDGTLGIPTEEVSIADVTADVSRVVALRLPDGAQADVPAVTVTVDIVPARGQLSFSVVPRLNGLGSGLTATLAPGAVQVTLSGVLADLQLLDPAAIVVTINVSGRGPGPYTLPVSVQAPAGTTLVTVAPAEVRVTLAGASP